MALYIFLGDKPLGGLEMPRGSEEVLVEVVVSASVSCPK